MGARSGLFYGDGYIDALCTEGAFGNPKPAKLFINRGSGDFSDSGQEMGLFTWSWIGSADLDNDNDLDLVISTFEQPTQIWINDGQGNFHDSELRLGNNGKFHGLDIGDLNGNNKPDICH